MVSCVLIVILQNLKINQKINKNVFVLFWIFFFLLPRTGYGILTGLSLIEIDIIKRNDISLINCLVNLSKSII